MVIPPSFNYDEDTYRDVLEKIRIQRSKDEYKNVINEDLDENISECECDDGEENNIAFENDKTYVSYCENCGGIDSGSTPGNWF